MLIQKYLILKFSPGLFHMYHTRSGTSMFEDFKESRLTLLYFIWPLSSGIVNLAAKVYSVWINKKLNSDLPVSYNHNHNQHLNEEKFILSLTSVLAIPLIMFTGYLSSFSNREIRLKILFPTQLTLLSIFLPLLLITTNAKLKQNVFLNFFEPSSSNFTLLVKNIKKTFSRKVSPHLTIE